jgi:hypothetical protein
LSVTLVATSPLLKSTTATAGRVSSASSTRWRSGLPQTYR